MLERRLLVQDRESRQFLGLDEEGDMSFVPYVNRAFKFEDDEHAAMSGLHFCDAGYLIFQFWVEYP